MIQEIAIIIAGVLTFAGGIIVGVVISTQLALALGAC
jgi:hypothetical protein